MLSAANQDNQSQHVISSQAESNHLSQMLLERIREARQYVKGMSNFPGDPQDAPEPAAGLGANARARSEPPYDPRINYLGEFWKIFFRNENHLKQIQTISTESSVLQQKLTEIEALEQQRSTQSKSALKKKSRRLAADIDKKHRCPYDKCFKQYGSSVSLNLHIKLKHNGGNKTDREKLAQEICMAEMSRSPPPYYNIEFPPGFLENYRRQFLKSVKKDTRV